MRPPEMETPPAGQGCGGVKASALRCELGLNPSPLSEETQTCRPDGRCFGCPAWRAMLRRFGVEVRE